MIINPDDDLLRTVVAPVDADGRSSTEVGEYSHDLVKAESQESILALKQQHQENGGKGVHVHVRKMSVNGHGNGIDRSRSSAGTVTGMVMSGNGNGAGHPGVAPAGMIMRTQEVTIAVETHGSVGHGGDLPAYPVRAARW